MDKRATRWTVSTPEKAAEAIVDAGLRGRAERYVPRAYWDPRGAARGCAAPGARVLGGGSAQVLVTRTGADERG